MLGGARPLARSACLPLLWPRISNPLIEDPRSSVPAASYLHHRRRDLMLFEIDEAATRIREEADPDANIIVARPR